MPPQLDEPWQPAPGSAFPADYVYFPPRRRKFQNRWWLHVVLFLATLYCTTFAGGLHYLSFAPPAQPLDISWFLFADPAILLPGLWYSLTLLAILGAHEFGHYYFCRRYDIDASLPYFIPAPLPLTGTLGAVIKIREPFPTRTALFDVGVAGPIAGFVMIIPALFFGIWQSYVGPMPTSDDVIYMGEPLLFQAVAWLRFGPIPPDQTIYIHPVVFAAWFGMLATALNLLPFGQLDGGHITYATLGRWATPISLATVATAIALTFNSTSWTFMTVMMLLMLILLGPRHPPVIYEYEPLAPSRRLIAVLALVIFILCFTPVPIETFIPAS